MKRYINKLRRLETNLNESKEKLKNELCRIQTKMNFGRYYSIKTRDNLTKKICELEKEIEETKDAMKKARCGKCNDCYFDRDIPHSCGYGITDGGMAIPRRCPKNGKEIVL